MEKIMLKIMNEALDQKSALKIYVEEMAKTDPQLEEGLKNFKKTIDGCWSYIVAKAQKELNNISGYVQPKVVFGWAVHYFTESDEAIKAEVGSISQSTTAQKPVNKEIKPKNEVAVSPKEKTFQLDLFSMFEEVSDDDEEFTEDE